LNPIFHEFAFQRRQRRVPSFNFDQDNSIIKFGSVFYHNKVENDYRFGERQQLPAQRDWMKQIKI